MQTNTTNILKNYLNLMHKHILALLLSFALSGIIFGQNDTILYYKGNFKPSTKQEADRIFEVKKTKKDTYFVFEHYLNYQGEWDSSRKERIKILNDTSLIIYEIVNDKIKDIITRGLSLQADGNYRYNDFNQEGVLIAEGQTACKFPLIKTGEVKDYHPNGILKSISIYENNQLISNQRWRKDGTKNLDNVFYITDTAPEFPYGSAGLQSIIEKSVIYPEKCQMDRIQGRVYVSFVIMEDGSLDGFEIARGIHPLLDAESIRVLKSMKYEWIPATVDGKNVKTLVTLPINFVLR